MSGALEYRTFRYHYATLKAGLGQSLIVEQAYARDLITRQERDDANRSGLTLDEKNGKLLDMVELRILGDPQRYHDFLNLLKEETTFTNLVDKLTCTYSELSEFDAKVTAGTCNGVSGKATSVGSLVPRPHPLEATSMDGTSRATQQPTLYDLIHHVKTTNWFKLGLKLGMKKYDLQVIEKDKRSDTDAAVQAMLRKWLRSSKNRTWKAIVDALRAIDCDEEDLAQELEEKFC